MIVGAHEDERALGDEAGGEVAPSEFGRRCIEGLFVAGAASTLVDEEGLGEGWEAGMDYYVCGFGV